MRKEIIKKLTGTKKECWLSEDNQLIDWLPLGAKDLNVSYEIKESGVFYEIKERGVKSSFAWNVLDQDYLEYLEALEPL